MLNIIMGKIFCTSLLRFNLIFNYDWPCALQQELAFLGALGLFSMFDTIL